VLVDHPEYRRAVYIRADETLDTRRKNTLKWLHDRARRQGRAVDLSPEGDKLIIDGVLVFTLTNGYIENAGTICDHPTRTDGNH
jgi:hypothetical protein